MLSNHIQALTNHHNTTTASSNTTGSSSSNTQPPIPPFLTAQIHPNQTPVLTVINPNNPLPPPRPAVTITTPPPMKRPPKISLPLFDGTNPLDLIFQEDNMFNYYQTLIAQRILLSVFYFTRDALSWYKHLATNDMLGTWAIFKSELEVRFGPSSYENHEATLFKLRQTSTVTEYQFEFENISNRVSGLSQQTLCNCFISGMRRDIQNELALLKSLTLHQAYGKARLVEEKLAQMVKTQSTIQILLYLFFLGQHQNPLRNPHLLPRQQLHRNRLAPNHHCPFRVCQRKLCNNIVKTAYASVTLKCGPQVFTTTVFLILPITRIAKVCRRNFPTSP
ncbi:hypothetical protein SSX86_007836 [Deinandra increscens subsp. villosa]|uniref:Retrotransposon gag domain-containing protein n=1 Tax=Deinandra increscens subsp. villosa TaxID=3103831 RepID=A0AAP0H6H2_9ASTR